MWCCSCGHVVLSGVVAMFLYHVICIPFVLCKYLDYSQLLTSGVTHTFISKELGHQSSVILGVIFPLSFNYRTCEYWAVPPEDIMHSNFPFIFGSD